MTIAYVLINAEPGEEENLLSKLKGIEGVKEAQLVYGVYDVVVKVEAKNMDDLKELIAFNIRNLSEVRSTQTMTVVEGV
jgi:DNA-binding Lrp family transcriptional regulator